MAGKRAKPADVMSILSCGLLTAANNRRGWSVVASDLRRRARTPASNQLSLLMSRRMPV